MPAVEITGQVRIRCSDPRQLPDWDAQVLGLRGAEFFHSAAWTRVLSGSYGFTPCHFTAHSGGRLVGLLPFMEVNSWLTGRRGISLPFTDRCEPLAEDESIRDQLLAAAADHGRRRRWRYAEYRGPRGDLCAASAAYHRHVLDLTVGETALAQGVESSTRRALRKAARSPLQLEFSTAAAAVRAFHGLLCLTRRRHGLPPQPLSFFLQLQREALAPGHGVIALVRHEGRPVAGALFLHFGRHAIFKYGASDESAQQLRPNNHVMWESIRWHARAGFERLDFGRTDLGHEGLRRFKLGWGAQELPLSYARWDYRRGHFASGAAATGEGASARLFRLLPLSWSRFIGAVLYRHVA